MDDNNAIRQKQDESVEIPWINQFEKIKRSPEDSGPDIDFITRLCELEGR